MTQWWFVIGSQRVSCRDIIEHATRTLTSLGPYAKPEFRHPDFREALLTVAGDSGAVNSRRLSKWIGANKDRIVNRLRIVERGMRAGFMTWQLEHMDGAGPTAV